jgi:hypothetical protein
VTTIHDLEDRSNTLPFEIFICSTTSRLI